jgi:hypothetical protein
MNATMTSTNTNKKNLAAQMREKAAAAAALRKENIPVNSNQPMITSTGKRNLPTSHYDSVPDSLGSTLKQGFLKKAKVAKVASPMDTYEISDREDSDTDDSGDSDSETEKQKKKVRESVFQVAPCGLCLNMSNHFLCRFHHGHTRRICSQLLNINTMDA